MEARSGVGPREARSTSAKWAVAPAPPKLPPPASNGAGAASPPLRQTPDQASYFHNLGGVQTYGWLVQN